MSITIGPAATDDLRPRITVIGIGGAGGNAIANMFLFLLNFLGSRE